VSEIEDCGADRQSCVPPEWTQLVLAGDAADTELEMSWLEQALAGQATAAVWTGSKGLVAPLSYRKHASLADACMASAERGWPVRWRRSGGGVVPQGPGILNLSLAYPCAQGVPASQAVYVHLCGVLGQALAGLGISSSAREVKGSFCDGRFNLATQGRGSARKIAGTAQYWRRAGTRHAVLAHALLLVDADPALLCQQANRFEAALGSDRHYDSDTLTNVRQAWLAAHPGAAPPADLCSAMPQHIAAALIH
jgi:lipoate-protein ligase A